ncbi:TniB protein [Rhodopseudomonas faecalis]|uniref:TniB protein n=1 Tax=Rhodopseudomonas faecalis TaxID=99655 RepID=A0A318TA30_9BRAD|nr:ATP-binding protein [Rhodopseudomonas faecalis]PYF01821.1 TniB protein [Rhodopseudomonas faecalis]
MPHDNMTDVAEITADPVALLHEEACNSTEFRIMETIRAKFLPTKRDAKLAEALRLLIREAVKRKDEKLPPSFENRGKSGGGLALIGRTGGGKSRSLQRYFEKHSVLRGYAEATSRSPLISITVPSPCTSMQLARALLRATGYAVQRDLPAHRLWEMAFERLHHMRKFIVHFDEMQHVVHNMPDKELQQMADTLKIAIDDHRITIILSGVETLKPFLQFDTQVLRRFTIVPFEEINHDNHGEIVHMVESYAKAANLKAKLGDREEVKADFIARLAHAALNAYGYSIVLTHLAIEHALQGGYPHLVPEDFATVFARKTGFAADRNPFIAPAWLDIDCSKIFIAPKIGGPTDPIKTKAKAKSKGAA